MVVFFRILLLLKEILGNNLKNLEKGRNFINFIVNVLLKINIIYSSIFFVAIHNEDKTCFKSNLMK